MTIIHVVLFSFLVVPLASTMHYQATSLKKYSPDSRLFSAEGSSRKFARRLSKPLVGNEGRVYVCSEKDLFSFESNGSIAWTARLNHTCNVELAPVYGGTEIIYVAAENKVLKINKLNVSNSNPAAEIVLSFEPADKEGKGEIIGLSVSTLSSSIYVNVRGRGLFAYTTNGRLVWSAGPVLNQFGYKQGCRKNLTECYFTSVPVIDRCEATVYISNNEGELYSLPIRSPHFKWVTDLSSLDKAFTITPGNNGRVYVVVPARTLLLALDVLTGNVVWQGSIGPLSSEDSTPVIDSNGWISIGSLDGFLYSFSPSGVLKKFSKSQASNSVIQATPVLDCSGYAIYISQTEIEGKTSHTIDGYTYVSAMKPTNVVFTLFVPATGSIYWSQTYPGELSSSFSHTDLQHFVVDERILLSFFAASKTGNKLDCRSRRQKLISGCSQARPKLLRLYTANERAVFLFLVFESAVLLLLAGLVRFCCVFWKKKKLQGQDLGSFLDKRRSLQLKEKSLRRTITELDGDEKSEEVDGLVRERDGIKRKLSTTYSLGRDQGGGQKKPPLLPLYDDHREKARARSLSLRGGATRGERAEKLFDTLSGTSSVESGSGDGETSWESFREDEPESEEKAEEADQRSDGGGIAEREIRRSPSEPGSSSRRSESGIGSRSRSLSLKRRKPWPSH